MGAHTSDDRVTVLHTFGMRELDAHLRTGDPAALERARTFFRQTVSAMTPVTPHGHVHLRNLALTEVMTHERSGALAPLRDAVVLYRRALDAAPPGHEYRPAYAYGLGRALRQLHQATGDPAHLDEAIAWQYRALPEELSGATAELPTQLGGLAESLLDRYEAGADPADLAESVRLYRHALSLAPADDPDRAARLVNLGSALGAQYRLTGDPAWRDEHIDAYAEALALLPRDRPERLPLLEALASALRERYEDGGGLDDLDTAIALLQRSAAATRPGTFEHAAAADQAGEALLARARTTADPHRASQAIALLEGAVAAEPPDGLNRGALLGSLATAYGVRHDLTGEPGDRDRAVALLRAAVETPRPTAHNLSALRSMLADALRHRHHERGGAADLEEAIAVHRTALAGQGTDDVDTDGTDADDTYAVDQAVHQAGLAACLKQRFEFHGDTADLDQSAELCRQALLVLPEGHVNRAAALVHLGDTHLARYRHTGRGEALNAALGAYRQAVSTDRGDQQGALLGNLASALLVRFEHAGGAAADLDEAIGLQRRARALLPADQETSGYNLAQSLRSRYEIGQDLSDLGEAVELLRGVVRSRPADHPDRISPCLALAECLHQLHLRTGDRDLLTEAAGAARDAAAVPGAPVLDRLRTHVTRGQVSGVMEDWETATRELCAATALLPELATRSLTRSDQQYALAKRPGLAAEAAAYAVQAGRYEQALEVLEHGRGVLLGRLLRTRELDVERLRTAAPDLADHFLRLRDENDEGPAAPSAPPLPGGPAQAAERRRARAAQWQGLLHHIRALPGFDDFLLPPSAQEILRQAGEGPVVLVNISIRCDALIVAGGTIDVLPLRTVSGAVTEKVATFLAATRDASRKGASLEDIWSAQEAVSGVLEWLWDTITGPVLQRLGYTEPAARGTAPRRIWWCPQGQLAFLPLHAAGYHGTRADPDDPRCALDLAVSSYTPTIGALHHARRRPEPGTRGPGTPLLVAIRNTPGAAPLPNALDEAETVAPLLPGATAARLLADEEATRERVRDALRTSASAHLVCHALTDPDDPSASRILTHDHLERSLTVADISALRPSGADLAYLSSCSTSRTRHELADEAIHITSAFQLAGYRHVVGTLWPVADEIAPRIARRFYAALPDGAAHALHAAVREAHAELPLLPSLWGAHIHVGP